MVSNMSRSSQSDITLFEWCNSEVMGFSPLHCIYGSYQIPQRYVLVAMLQLAITNSMHLRMVLNLVAAELKETGNYTLQYDACPQYNYSECEKIKLDVPFGWSLWLRKYSSYSFYLGYTLGQLPLGWLADMYGARHVLGTGMLVSAITIMLVPLSIKSRNQAVILSVQVVFGFAQSSLYPSVSSFLQHWCPNSEMALVGGLALSGNGFLAILLTGVIVRYSEDWATPFYVYGGFLIVWYAFYLLMVFSQPYTHPFIDTWESNYLATEIAEKLEMPTPWRGILSSGAVWSLSFVCFGDSYTSFTLLGYFVNYMNDILKWNLRAHNFINASPYFFYWVTCLLTSWLASFILDRKLCRLRVLRTVYALFANVVAPAFLMGAVYVGCNQRGALVLHGMALVSKGFIINSLILNPNDLTCNFAGTVMGIVNSFGALAGILGPWMVSYLTQDGTVQDWKQAFGILFGVSFGATAVYVFFSEMERQPWDFPPKDED